MQNPDDGSTLVAVSTSEIIVRFHGQGAGVGDLTWGQKGIWDTIQYTGRTMNIGGAMPLPPGTPLQEIETLLRYVVGRHQALRTKLLFTEIAPGTATESVPGASAEQPAVKFYPRQVVFEQGEIPLQIVDVPYDQDADAEAEVLRAHYELTAFDYAAEWPVRMGVIRQSGKLTHLVVQYSHLAVDGSGIEAVVRDLAHMDPATGTATAPVSGVTPLELAGIQGTAAGRRHSDKSLRYWAKLLRSIPAQRFNGSDDPRDLRFQEIVCYSPAMHLAIRSIAARTGADGSHVLLAAYAVALARVTGRSPSVAQVIVNNRFRPGFAEAVSQLCQCGICAIDVADSTFDEVVIRAWKGATDAYLHGYFSTTAHQDTLREIAAERGEPIDISCYVNDRRGQTPAAEAPDAALPTPEELSAALAHTTLRWDRAQPTYDGSFYLHVDAQPDTNVPGRVNPGEQDRPAVYFAIWGDTHCFAPADIEACARQLEAVVVEAAFDGEAPTRVS
jgi:Condensation domain